MKRAAVVGLTVFAVMALPVTARSDTAKTIVQGAAAGVLTGIMCSGFALTADDEIDPEDFARRGFFAGVAGSYAVETFEDDLESNLQRKLGVPASLSVDDSFGFDGRLGYRCHRRFAGEVQVEWLDGFDSDLSAPGFGQLAKPRIEPIVVTANFRGFLMTGRYQPFLLVGGGAMTAETKNLNDNVGLPLQQNSSDNAFAMRFGGGVDFYATKNIVVNLEADYVLPFGNLDDLDYISIVWGVQYRF